MGAECSFVQKILPPDARGLTHVLCCGVLLLPLHLSCAGHPQRPQGAQRADEERRQQRARLHCQGG
jgi:hypothetical protein